MNNISKFCPLQSKADNKVLCDKNCMFFQKLENKTNCAIVNLSENVNDLIDEIQNLRLNLPITYDE